MPLWSEDGDLGEGCGQVEARDVCWQPDLKQGMAVWEQESREGSREKSPGFTGRTSASQIQNERFSMQNSNSESFYYKEELSKLH